MILPTKTWGLPSSRLTCGFAFWISIMQSSCVVVCLSGTIPNEDSSIPLRFKSRLWLVRCMKALTRGWQSVVSSQESTFQSCVSRLQGGDYKSRKVPCQYLSRILFAVRTSGPESWIEAEIRPTKLIMCLSVIKPSRIPPQQPSRSGLFVVIESRILLLHTAPRMPSY